jgi:hypothetical protein
MRSRIKKRRRARNQTGILPSDYIPGLTTWIISKKHVEASSDFRVLFSSSLFGLPIGYNEKCILYNFND